MNAIIPRESTPGVREFPVMNGKQYYHQTHTVVIVNVKSFSREDLFLELFGDALYIRTHGNILISSILFESKYDCQLLTARLENDTVVVTVPISTRPRSRIINLE